MTKMKEWSERQKVIFDVYEKTNKNIVVEATAGCLGLNTPVLMYNGSIKLVQDIKVGDQVMGPDSTSRTVLQLHRGYSRLYKICPKEGDTWICNEEHILTVWNSKKNVLEDICLKDILFKNFETLYLKRIYGQEKSEIVEFTIKFIGQGDYYGFTVDKDERFLLGDFTITHNSGKTTTIVELCKRTPVYKKCFFSAFNKSIAEELSSRLPERIDVSTFHSKGLKTLLKNFRFKLKVNENKCFKIGKQISTLDDVPEKQQLRYLFDLQTIWNSIRLGLLVDYEQDIPNICVEKDIDFKPRMIEDIRNIEEEWLKRAKFINNGRDFEVDFTDMLYLPYILLKSEDFSKYDVVVVDECQDLCTLQKELIFNYIKPLGGRLICVGDSKQCIYSFIGSSVSNFKQLQNLDNTVTLPLDVTYRCARSVVEEAKKVFSQGIEAAENAIEGVVRKGNLEEARTGDFVLCRNNLPLIDAFIILLQKEIKASIKDRDFGKSLLNILEKINRIEDLDILMNEKLEELKERGLSKAAAMNNASYLSLEEKCSILEKLSDIWTSVEVMKSKIEKIYTEDEKDGVVLSTIHKSKGLESNRVFFLNPNLIPSPKVTCEEALYSEYCLKFVAITRAKKELIYCTV